jgi:hypothetical protein
VSLQKLICLAKARRKAIFGGLIAAVVSEAARRGVHISPEEQSAALLLACAILVERTRNIKCPEEAEEAAPEGDASA